MNRPRVNGFTNNHLPLIWRTETETRVDNMPPDNLTVIQGQSLSNAPVTDLDLKKRHSDQFKNVPIVSLF